MITKAPVELTHNDCEDNLELSFPAFCRVNGKPISKDQLYELQEEIYNKQGKIYQCNHCKYNNKQRRAMRIHTHRHIDFLEFDCDICGKTAPGVNALRIHKYRQHSESPDDALVCKTCNIQFTTQYFKKKHIQTCRNGPKPNIIN